MIPEAIRRSRHAVEPIPAFLRGFYAPVREFPPRLDRSEESKGRQPARTRDPRRLCTILRKALAAETNVRETPRSPCRSIRAMPHDCGVVPPWPSAEITPGLS